MSVIQPSNRLRWPVLVILFIFSLLTAFSSHLLAAPQFPKLSGHVVDDANLLTVSERKRLSSLLQEHESRTTNEVVVVTLKSLQGYSISDYGLQLGRYWGLGKQGRGNGVILIVAPSEREVRIEVGRGLENLLSDKISSDIIESRIVPAFRIEKFDTGIRRGTEEILGVLAGTIRSPAVESPRPYNSRTIMFAGFMLVLILGFGMFYFRDKPPNPGTIKTSSALYDDDDDDDDEDRFRHKEDHFASRYRRPGRGGFSGGGASSEW